VRAYPCSIFDCMRIVVGCICTLSITPLRNGATVASPLSSSDNGEATVLEYDAGVTTMDDERECRLPNDDGDCGESERRGRSIGKQGLVVTVEGFIGMVDLAWDTNSPASKSARLASLSRDMTDKRAEYIADKLRGAVRLAIKSKWASVDGCNGRPRTRRSFSAK